MSILDKLASSFKRRDEVPNRELAKKITTSKDKKAVKELVENLSNKNKDIQSDCIKVIYEIGELNPSLIASYGKELVALLDSKNNRLQWGAMTALNSITSENPEVIYSALAKIISVADKGSVITNDHCVAILIKLCAIKIYEASAFLLLNERLLKSPTNQLPMYAENALPVISDKNKALFAKTLNSRLKDIEKETKRKWVEKVLKKIAGKLMAFYDLSKEERARLVLQISAVIEKGLQSGDLKKTMQYFEDEDTYIRKSAYLSIGRIYFSNKALQAKIIKTLKLFFVVEDFKIRQTVINAAGEIGKVDFETVRLFFDKGLFDPHHSPRNAVIGSIKKMGEVNPKPVLSWAKEYLHHENKEIRREICHGIELRGRKYPQEILPLLKELQFDKTARVRNTLVHVIGQIAYKKGCLETVISDLKKWQNKELVTDALEEIIDVHERYKDFSVLTQKQAIDYIKKNYSV